MNDDNDLFQLPEDRTEPASGQSLRLDSIKKKRTIDSSDSLRKMRQPTVKTVVNNPSTSDKDSAVLLENNNKRSSHEGKSVEYTIDEILQSNPKIEEGTEKEWGATSKSIPIGWIIMLSTLMITVIAAIVYLISKNQINENQIAQSRQIDVVDQITTTDVAQDLVNSIEQTVHHYLAATSIEEKIAYVRHAEAIRPRMEKFYAANPIVPVECKMVTSMKPISLEGRVFWQVVAVTGDKKGQAILLEQLSTKEVKVDWESHVYYQPMPWEQYAVEQPIQPMAFRLKLKESPRYFGEFSNQSRWVSYELTAARSETILYGYVLRNSPAHQFIQQAIQYGHQYMILRLQASKTIQLPNAVVIESFVSADLFRLDPPKTLID